jgi:predicted amidohydrolase
MFLLGIVHDALLVLDHMFGYKASIIRAAATLTSHAQGEPFMSVLTVALLQLADGCDDQATNLAKGEAFCRRARSMGADIALFPELWNIAYTFDRHAVAGTPDEAQSASDLWRAPELWTAGDVVFDAVSPALLERWQAQAIDRTGSFVSHFRALARDLDMAIALTYLERWPGLPRNTVSLIDRRGEIVLTYAKVHTCDFDLPEMLCTPGDDFFACTLDTAQGDVRVGAMICYDREFPESARILMLKGAEIILTPNACDMNANQLGQFRARAYENMVGVAMANYAKPGFGHSVAYDPIAFGANGARDTLLIEAGEREGIYMAEFDLDAIREYRRRETWGNAFRRPHRYAALVALDVAPPFVRVNARGERYDPSRR